MNEEKGQLDLPQEVEFPLNLRYADAQPPVLEFKMVKKLGRRYRRRYRAVIGSSVTASMAAATLFACTVASTSGSMTAAPDGTQSTISSLPTDQYPPLGVVSTLGTVASGPRAGWSEVAWISSNNVLCYGVADLRQNGSGVSVSCATTPTELAGDAMTPAVYTPMVTADVPDPNSILVFGFARGAVDAVSITTSFGTSATSKTIITLDRTKVRAYAVMVPMAGSKEISTSEMRISAMNAEGGIVAHFP